MRGSNLQGASYETLRDAFVDGRELYQARAELEKQLSETAAVKVRDALLDHLADFLTFRTPDETEIMYQGKPLGDYSLGQRATVILYILMHLPAIPSLSSINRRTILTTRRSTAISSDSFWSARN